jgi:hypothetical protein
MRFLARSCTSPSASSPSSSIALARKRRKYTMSSLLC